MDNIDTLVVGAGVVGLAAARALAQAGREVVIAEAREAFGTVTSARSSEVIHAGLYYPTGSLKARLCVRGRDLLSSTPRQLYLYRLLNAAPPEYYHVPLLTAPDGRRLSKRDRDLDLGILRGRHTAPELLGALAHAAGLLDKREPISAEELIPLFDWAKIPKDDIAIDV